MPRPAKGTDISLPKNHKPSCNQIHAFSEHNGIYMAALLIIILLITAGEYTSVYGEQPENVTREIVYIMVSCGFENVRAFALDDALIVEYENRIYLREKDAVKLIMARLTGEVGNIQKLILVPKRDDVPLFQIAIVREDYQPDTFRKIEISKSTVSDGHISTAQKYNSSAGKMDIILRPEWDFLLGRFNDPLIHRLAISPEYSLLLGKGIRCSAQTRFLLYDESNYKGKRVALGKLCLDYTYRSSAPIFVNLGGGYFGDERYGLSSEALFFGWKDRIGVRGTAAWLGNMYYWEDTLYYTKMWKWTALAHLQCRLPFWNVLITTRVGRFLYMDYGVSSEITRFYRNSCLTIFAAKTDRGSIGGFEIQFLPYPRRHPKPRRVRVRLPTILGMRYRYLESEVGIPFSPGYDIDYAVENFWLMDIE